MVVRAVVLDFDLQEDRIQMGNFTGVHEHLSSEIEW